MTTTYYSKRLTKLAAPESTVLVIDPRKVGQQSTTRNLYKRTEAWLSKSVDPDAQPVHPTREDFVHYVTKSGVLLSPVERNWLIDQGNRTGAVDQDDELGHMVICSDGRVTNDQGIDADIPGTVSGLTTNSGFTPAERTEDQVRRSNSPYAAYWTEDQVKGMYGPYRILGRVTVKHVTIGGLVTRSMDHHPGHRNRMTNSALGGQATKAKHQKWASNGQRVITRKQLSRACGQVKRLTKDLERAVVLNKGPGLVTQLKEDLVAARDQVEHLQQLTNPK